MKPKGWWCPACLRQVLTIQTTAFHGDFCQAEGGPWEIHQGIMRRPGRGAGSYVLHEPSCRAIQAERSVRRGERQADKQHRRSEAITRRRREAAVRDEALAAPTTHEARGEAAHRRAEQGTREAVERAARAARPPRGGHT